MKPSGKFVLRLDPSLHQALKTEAESRNLSMNEWIVKNLTGSRSLSQAPISKKLLSVFGTDLIGVIQFGSSVRNEMRANSDIDLLIVLEPGRPIDRGLYQIWDLEFLTDAANPISPQFSHLPKNQSPSSLWLEVALEGIILFDPRAQLIEVTRRLRGAIAEGQFLRKMSHGHPYWVRKETGNAQ